MLKYALEIASTGKVILLEETELSMVNWQKKKERKLLRYKRTPADVRTAIQTGDTIVGWTNYDALLMQGNDMQQMTRLAFRGYDKFYEGRISAQQSITGSKV